MIEHMLVAHTSIVEGQCGIGTIKNIRLVSELMARGSGKKPRIEGSPPYIHFEDTGYSYNLLESVIHQGGCKLVGTGFIPTDVCKQAYDILCKKRRLVFQTPVRKNSNSLNFFFYAMFDEIDDPKENGYLPTLQPKWPF